MLKWIILLNKLLAKNHNFSLVILTQTYVIIVQHISAHSAYELDVSDMWLGVLYTLYMIYLFPSKGIFQAVHILPSRLYYVFVLVVSNKLFPCECFTFSTIRIKHNFIQNIRKSNLSHTSRSNNLYYLNIVKIMVKCIENCHNLVKFCVFRWYIVI